MDLLGIWTDHYRIKGDYLTVFCNDAEKLSIDKAVVKLDNTGVVEFRQQSSFVHCINSFIGLEVTNRNLLQNLSENKHFYTDTLITYKEQTFWKQTFLYWYPDYLQGTNFL